MQTLLDLGASPSYKDHRGLTPLYHAAMKDSQAGPQCVQMLLYNRSDIGVVDNSCNTELHQVGHAFICQSLTFCSAIQPFIWRSRFSRLCAQIMELFTSANPKHTLHPDVIL